MLSLERICNFYFVFKPMWNSTRILMDGLIFEALFVPSVNFLAAPAAAKSKWISCLRQWSSSSANFSWIIIWFGTLKSDHGFTIMHFSIPETVDRKDPKGSTYTVRHFFRLKRTRLKYSWWYFIQWKRKEKLEEVNGRSIIHFYILFRSEKNNLEFDVGMSSNQGIAIGAEMFRFFLHRSCDTTARYTAVNNKRKLLI